MENRYNRIKEVLKAQGRSQAWLAERVGLSNNAINSICKNKSQPRIETLYNIAEALDVDVCGLLVSTKEGPEFAVVDSLEVYNLLEAYLKDPEKRKAINEVLNQIQD